MEARSYPTKSTNHLLPELGAAKIVFDLWSQTCDDERFATILLVLGWRQAKAKRLTKECSKEKERICSSANCMTVKIVLLKI
jgi:hypothetical protein